MWPRSLHITRPAAGLFLGVVEVRLKLPVAVAKRLFFLLVLYSTYTRRALPNQSMKNSVFSDSRFATGERLKYADSYNYKFFIHQMPGLDNTLGTSTGE